MTLLLSLRFAKLVSSMVFAAGILGTLVASDLPTRRRFAYFLAGPGFGATWVLGFALVGITDASPLSTWAILAMVSSFTSLQAVLWLAGREGRSQGTAGGIAVVGWLLTVGSMVFRSRL